VVELSLNTAVKRSLGKDIARFMLGRDAREESRKS
jgi:hypothetical protein